MDEKSDPIIITIDRRVEAFEALFDSKLRGLSELYDSKLKGLLDLLDAYSEMSKVNLQAHCAEVDERFKSIQLQFSERDKRFDLAAKDNALATVKSESLATKQIEQLSITMVTGFTNIDSKINDSKDRINSMESYNKGASGLWASILSGVSAVVAVGTFLILIFHLKSGVG
jgi:hypothetical protein